MAQVNPKRGYIITNENDTIHGTVDYRSDARNAQVCSFKVDGAPGFRDYRPGDISGYRLDDNGTYYVSRTFPVDGKDVTMFAEYLLKGGMSLYYHLAGNDDLYYFVDENGRVAVLKEQKELTGNRHENARIKREYYREVLDLFSKSGKAQKDLWTTDGLSPKVLTKITREYNEQYCTSYGDCIEYHYKNAGRSSAKVRLRLKAGASIGTLKAERYHFATNLDYHAVMPLLGIGCDFLLPRVSRHLAIEAMLTAGYWSATGTASKEQHVVKDDYKLSFINAELQLGAAYRFSSEQKTTPVLHGGLFLNQKFASSGLVADFYDGQSSAMGFRLGFYAGAGLDFPVGKHTIRIEVNYKTLEINPQTKGDSRIDLKSAVELNAGILF